MKLILTICGIISLSLGIIGIFLPLLPTTPFLLLSAFLFARSSAKYYNWLMNHKIFGQYIRNFNENKSIPLKAKILSIILLWTTVIYSILCVIEEKSWLQITLACIAIVVTYYLLSLKTMKQSE